MFSLTLIGAPAASAAFYHVVREGLLDPFEMRTDLRVAFRAGFCRHFRRALVLAVANLLVLGVILFGILFRLTFDGARLDWVAGIAAAFLVVWWLCQPFLFPLLVEYPEARLIEIARFAIRLVLGHFPYAFLVSFFGTVINLFGFLLLGPALLVTGPLVALAGIQSLWVVIGVQLPDLQDPVEYANVQDYY